MKNFSILILLLCTGVACANIQDDTSEMRKELSPTAVHTKSTPQFDTLPNPYTLVNMQATLDSLSDSGITLQFTDYYVRFLPVDSLQLHNLIYTYNLELFDFPLDLEIGEGEVYEDPSISEGDITWQYTTVKPNFVFPPDITYEILEQCYVPPDNDTIPNTKSGDLLYLEAAAFERLGYTVDPPVFPETKAGVKPTGRIRVVDNSQNGNPLVPVQGVKIRCHTIIKWSTTYTDDNGFYTMDSKFSIGPHYAIVFDNKKGFDIWGNWGPIARANYNMGWHSKNGHDRDLPANSTAWQWAVVNNAGYDYYQMCETTGITKPPSKLKIWVIKNATSSSTPMFRHVNQLIGYNDYSFWENFLFNTTFGVAINILLPVFKIILPDIFIGTQGSDYREIYNVTNHELSHASHFSKVGSAYWAKYISYIVTYGAYGNGTGKNFELCGIGEMWGYAMGYRQECEKYETILLSASRNWTISGGIWIRPEIFWDLLRDNILTKKQIYDCLSSDVDTYYKLIEKMYQKYPAQTTAIDSIFVAHGIIQNVPNQNNTTTLENLTITSNTVVSGKFITSQNVTVSNNAKLTLNPETSVTINAPFTINNSSQFEIIF